MKQHVRIRWYVMISFALIFAGLQVTQGMFVENDPVNKYDPLGLLTRQQLDWLAGQWVPNWQGVGPASQQDVVNAIKIIRQELRKLSPQGFQGDVWSQSYADDIALQKLLDTGTKGLKGFPGKAYDQCWDCTKIKKWIDDARRAHNIKGLSDSFILAWVMKESSWVTTASAYGRTAGTSTATGLTQILKSTWELPGFQKGLPASLQGGWQQITLDPTLSLAAGMWVLERHPGATVDAQLAAYKGRGGKQYVQRIRQGENLVNTLLGGKSIDQLSATDCQKLMTQLDKLVQ